MTLAWTASAEGNVETLAPKIHLAHHHSFVKKSARPSDGRKTGVASLWHLLMAASAPSTMDRSAVLSGSLTSQSPIRPAVRLSLTSVRFLSRCDARSAHDMPRSGLSMRIRDQRSCFARLTDDGMKSARPAENVTSQSTIIGLPTCHRDRQEGTRTAYSSHVWGAPTPQPKRPTDNAHRGRTLMIRPPCSWLAFPSSTCPFCQYISRDHKAKHKDTPEPASRLQHTTNNITRPSLSTKTPNTLFELPQSSFPAPARLFGTQRKTQSNQCETSSAKIQSETLARPPTFRLPARLLSSAYPIRQHRSPSFPCCLLPHSAILLMVTPEVGEAQQIFEGKGGGLARCFGGFTTRHMRAACWGNAEDGGCDASRRVRGAATFVIS